MKLFFIYFFLPGSQSARREADPLRDARDKPGVFRIQVFSIFKLTFQNTVARFFISLSTTNVQKYNCKFGPRQENCTSFKLIYHVTCQICRTTFYVMVRQNFFPCFMVRKLKKFVKH
jgi:hypothetical protein